MSALTTVIILILSVSCLIGCRNAVEERQKHLKLLSQNVEEFKTQGKYEEALAALHELEVFFFQSQNDSLLAETYYRLGEIYQECGAYDSALVEYYNGIERAQRSFHTSLEQRMKYTLAQLLIGLGELAQAKVFAEECARTAQFSSDEAGYATARFLSAQISHQMGDYNNEIRILDELESKDYFLNANETLIAFRTQQMKAYTATEQFDSVNNVFHRWRQYAIEEKDTFSLFYAYYRWAKAHESFGQLDSATAVLKSVVKNLEKFPNDTLTVKALESLGLVYFRKGNYKEAKSWFQQAANMTDTMNIVAAELRNNLQSLLCDIAADPALKKIPLTSFREQCTGLQKQCEDFHLYRKLSQAFYVQGKIAQAEEHPATALKYYYQSLRFREQSLLMFDEDGVDDDAAMFYNAALDIECSIENVDSVFALAERKILHDIVRFFSQLPLSALDRTLQRAIERYQFLRYSLALLEKTMENIISTRTEKDFNRLYFLNENYKKTLSELSVAEREMQQQNTWMHRLFSLQPLTLSDVRQLLPVRSSLIEFIPLNEAVYALIVQKDTVVIRKIHIPLRQLETKAKKYAEIIRNTRLAEGNIPSYQNTELQYHLEMLSAELYDMLITPIERYLREQSILYIVPPKELLSLPFHTLTNTSERLPVPLQQRYEVRYLPTASVLAYTGTPRSSSVKIAGFGHPGRTQWDVEYELKDIWSFQHDAQIFFDGEATFDRLASLSADVLHLAVEMNVHPLFPGNSKILLSRSNTGLQVEEVPLGEFSLLGKFPLLVVSNIAEQRAEVERYVPMLFLSSGTRACVMTLWRGDRKTKKDFGEFFYTHLLIGVSAEEAFRESVRTLSRNKETSPHYRWGMYYYFGR